MDALPRVRKNVLFVRNENEFCVIRSGKGKTWRRTVARGMNFDSDRQVDDLPIVGKNVPFVRNEACVSSFLSTPP